MGSEGSGERVFRKRGGGSSGLNSGMAGTNSVSDKVSLLTMCSEPMFHGSNWDPIMSLCQSGNLGNSNMVSQSEFANPLMLENQTMGGSLVQFPPDLGLAGLLPRIPTFGNGSFSEMITSFGHDTHSNPPHKMGVSQDQCQNLDNGMSGASPHGKRRKEVTQSASSPKNAEDEEEEEQKEKQVGKQAKDNSNGAEDSYIHVRDKRGQATNSHSLAERVRRERISERMRLLQELVPGCNKITGKAMMLDEIINYVQSLQQQVEFLSMKLSTVNPELNMDIDRILSKDILHLHSNNAGPFDITPGLSSSLPFPEYPQGAFHNATGRGAFHSSPQHVVEGLLQMGFDPNPTVSIGPNGPSKMEL